MGTCRILRKVGLSLNWSGIYGNSWGHRLKDPRKFSMEIFDSEFYCVICGNSEMWTIDFDSGIPLPSKYPYCPRCYNARFGRIHGIIGIYAAWKYIKGEIDCHCKEHFIGQLEEMYDNRRFPLATDKAYKMGISAHTEHTIFFPIVYLKYIIREHFCLWF